MNVNRLRGDEVKIRNGFVSNSSSSSFIVCFPKRPETAEEVRQLMFGDLEYMSHPYEFGAVDTKQIAETVFADLKPQRAATFNKVIKILKRGWDGPPNLLDDYFYDRITHEEFKQKQDDWAQAQAEKFMDECKGIIYIFRYGDDDGSYFAALEHGEIFRNLKYYRVSQH